MTAKKPRDTQTRCSDCGWVSKTTTAGLAQHALNSHSCELHRTRTARAERIAARAVGGPQRPCLHKQTQHQHGTHAAYALDGCRCAPCRTAHRDYSNSIAKAKAYGRWNPYVDAQPVREHIQGLLDQGMGLKRIIVVSGVSSGTTSKLMYSINGRPPSRHLRHHTAAALLAVQLDHAAGALVDATGTWRRLEALVAIGWPKSHLAQRLGLARALQFDRKLVTAGNAAKVRALYLELQHTPGPSARARSDAQRAGYLSPYWWDDDTIDDPSYQPDTRDTPRHWSEIDDIAVDLACSGRDVGRPLTRAERITAVLRLTDQGLPASEISQRLQIPQRQVVRIRSDHGQRVA